MRTIYRLTMAGTMLTMAAIGGALYFMTGDGLLLLSGVVFFLGAALWMALLMRFVSRRLTVFTGDICGVIDRMIDGEEQLMWGEDEEACFARIHHRLLRLYEILRESRQQAMTERRKIQSLVSDISHQVKTPLGNLRMVTDTLLTKRVSKQERTEFLQGISGQTDKLDFLLGALVKMSRLESGVIRLEKTNGRLYDTLAQAMSGIVYGAERKRIAVTVDCPEELWLFHDKKWTAEAFFNLLDNAVKYTPEGGSICVTARAWEMYERIDISDTGKGIAESRQASVFMRFYREEEVHDTPGVGIGLYLAREMIVRQGGYIKLTSEVGKGSTFSVFLPRA